MIFTFSKAVLIFLLSDSSIFHSDIHTRDAIVYLRMLQVNHGTTDCTRKRAKTSKYLIILGRLS